MDPLFRLADVIRSLISTIRSSATARLVAVVCAVAFLSVTLIHGAHYFNAPVLASVLQADVGSSDDVPEAPIKGPITSVHDHGCSGVAMPVLAQAAIRLRITANVPSIEIAGLLPSPPGVESRPPISTI